MSGLAPGTPIGPYRVLEPLGLGAMGEVYRVTDGVGRQLALKLLRGRMDGARLERFAREGEVAAGLRHSGIVQVHATGVADQGPYLVYELVEGEDLERAWRRLDRDQLLEITLHVAQALGHAHAQGVVHRDVKPANVLLDGRGRARLADFGLAQAVGLERLTQSGAVLGTPHYMAPEQAAGQRTRYGPPTDVWALGVLLYRALTGRLPFSGPDLMTLAARIASVEPPPPRQLDPTLSPGLEAVCLRALHKDPDRRYADAEAFARDLARARAGAPLEARARRGRGPRVAGALGLLALLGAGAWGLWPAPAAGPAPVELKPPAPPPDPRVQALAVQAEALDAAVAGLVHEASGAESALRRVVDAARRSPELQRALWERGTAALARAWEDGASSRVLPLARAVGQLEARGDPLSPVAQRVTEGYLGEIAEVLHRAPTPEAAADYAGACDLLGLLSDCGFRLLDPAPGVQVHDGLTDLVVLGQLPWRDYWRAHLASVRLDLPCGPNAYSPSPLVKQQPARERPWGESPSDPWERFVELMIQATVNSTPSQLAALSTAVDRPAEFGGEGWRLGPRHEAVAFVILALHEDDAARIRRLQRAAEADPLNVTVPCELGIALLRAGRAEEAREVLATGGRLCDEVYPANPHRHYTRVQLLSRELMALVALGRQGEARVVYRRLRELDLGIADEQLRSYPWLKDPE